mgnify:CR=1 FL=1
MDIEKKSLIDKITDKKYIHDTVAGEKDNDPRTITCKTNDDGENTCANIQYITTTATYDIFYKDDLKWFSDKSLKELQSLPSAVITFTHG